MENEPTPDGIVIEGGTLGGGTIRTFHDHHIAMAFAMAGLRASRAIEILDCITWRCPSRFDHLAVQSGLKLAIG